MDPTGAAGSTEGLPVIEDQRTIKPFYVLLADLGKELMNYELQQAILLCSNQGLPAEKLKSDTPLDLLKTLDEYGLIGEDNTNFLKQILEKSDCVPGKVMVEGYEEKRREHLRNVEIILGQKDPLFVGRTTFVSKILDVFQDNHQKCRCVLVYGLAGTGKTKLAVESCVVYKEQARSGTRLFRVNLRKATEVEEVGLWILNTVLEKKIAGKNFDLGLVKRWIQKCSQDTVLLLDNADDILNPSSLSRDHFVNTLTDLLSIQNRFVKILLTSRHPVDFMGLADLLNFLEIKLDPLHVDESLQLMKKMVQRFQLSTVSTGELQTLHDDDALTEVAKLCGNNPQALRAVASRLNSGFSPQMLVECLKNPARAERVLDPGSLGTSAAVQDERRDFEDQPLVLCSIGAMYEQLSSHLKESLLKLSIFPSSFSLSQGARILGSADSEAKLDLEDLKRWSLLEREVFDALGFGLNEDEPHYYAHPLVRSVCFSKMATSKIYKEAYEDAVRRFISYIAEFLNNLTDLGHKDFSKALARFEIDKTNVIHCLELSMGQRFGCSEIGESKKDSLVSEVSLPDTKEGLYSLFETFLDPEKRLEYYQNMSIKMQSSNEPEAWAYIKGWVADELFVKAKYDNAWETVEEPLKMLKEREALTGRTNDLERAEAQLNYVKGRILVVRQNYKEGIAILKNVLQVQQRRLGDHSLTARCLNALGHAYFNKTDEDRHASAVNEAHDYHKKSWEMLDRITGKKPERHFDAPMYLLNIGASYHQMGKKCRPCDKKKANQYFELAIKNYKEAHELERALKLSNTPNTAFILKNMAMSHCEMEEYEKALPLAVDACDIREDTIGVHPTTARNLFFIGSLYDSIGDNYKKSKEQKDKDASVSNYKRALEYYKRALRMEIKLGPSNHSIEYEDLKDDLKDLLKKLHMDKEIEQYRRLFKAADKGTPDMEDTERVLTSHAVPDSPSRKRTQDEMSVDDGATDEQDSPEEIGDESESGRRNVPGPIFLQESPGKRKRCTLS